METIPISECKKVRYATTWQAIEDFEEGEEFFTNVGSETLSKIEKKEDIKRYFYRLYIRK